MASRVSTFSARRERSVIKYPWREWTDGTIWRITRGEDFTCGITNMKAMLRTRAWRLGRSVHIISPADSEHSVIEFQFGGRTEGA